MTGTMIYGAGYNSAKRSGGYKTKLGKGVLKEYDHWRSMLRRVYCEEWKSTHPTYEGATISTPWLDYQEFAQWYSQREFVSDNLDKDLLVLGNKVYSPETCVLLPSEVNKVITFKGRVATWHSRDRNYQASCGGVYLGSSQSPVTFAEEWLKAKYGRIKEVAILYKNSMPDNAYEALMDIRLEVGIDGTVRRVV